jgi:hypothetical protein
MENEYRFGGNGEYMLSRRALNHIMLGDFTVRVEDDPSKPRTTKVLSGGLHVFSAWKSLLLEHPEIVSLDEFDSEVDGDWFYARELQNGVITLKIPKILFSGKAANLTLMPETYYKSGYLWKTLFPSGFTEADVLDCIRQALINVERESLLEPIVQGVDHHIIGYARTENPFTAMRIQIQLCGHEIRSAFPSWTQPWTGNNGKPFSHSDTISFLMSESVLRAPPLHNLQSSLFVGKGKPSYEALKRITPFFVLARKLPKPEEAQDEWRTAREADLEKISKKMNRQDAMEVKAYLVDHIISKEPSFLQQQLYSSRIPQVSNNPLDFNACQISQNVFECFYVLLQYDIENDESFFLDCMKRYLSMTVIHTGGIHLFEVKRLYKLFLRGVRSHSRKDSISVFIEYLAVSPSRCALYHEFNVNTYTKKHDENSMIVIGVSDPKLPIRPEVVVDFVALNLGENYLVSFNQSQRLEIAGRILRQIPLAYMRDTLRYFTGIDFQFFCDLLPSLLKIENKNPVNEKELIRVIKDYHRMLVVYRQRVVMDDVISYRTDRWDLEYMSSEFCEVVIQQHKRDFVVIMHQRFLENMEKLAGVNGMEKTAKTCAVLLKSIDKEAVPHPSRIPDYIDSWMKDPKYYREADDIDFSIFER